MKAEQYAIDGLALLIDSINDVVENVNPDLEIYGALLTAYDKRTSYDKAVMEELPEAGEALGFKVFKKPIRICQDVKKTQGMKDSVTEDGERVPANRSLFDNFPSSNAAEDYVATIKELLDTIGYRKGE